MGTGDELLAAALVWLNRRLSSQCYARERRTLTVRWTQEWLASRTIGAELFREHSGRDSCVDGFHEVQNHVNDGLIADRRIDHSVVNGAVRPFDAEILLYEIDALAVNGIHELLGFLLTFAASQEAAHFIFSGGVEKHTQRVWAASQKMLRPPSNDDGVSRLSGVLNDAFCNFQNGFAVN